MNFFVKSLTIVLILLGTTMVQASSYTYEKRDIDNHVVHIVLINPKNYDMEIVKANKKGDIGRETVAAMAKQHDAEIAINGGYFEIGGNHDGAPSRTLVVKGHKYKMNNKVQALVIINEGKISILEDNPKKYFSNNVSIVSGIPMLINHGQIAQAKNSEFYTKPHARTAIGVKQDHTVVLVVAEHGGLTISALAQLMKELGCQSALNLDGGGSSTLWLKNKVVNQTMGDKDEGDGLQILRPVSDAIIFKLRLKA